MSFGIGVGDILAVLELANKVRQRWSDAPGEYGSAREEIKQLEAALRDLNDLSDRVDIPPSQKDTLGNAVNNCKVVLTTANKIVDTYSTSTTTSTNRLRRTWQRLKADPDDVRNLRSQLVSTVAQLHLVQSNMQIELDRDILENVQDLKISHDDENKLKIANWFSPPSFAEQQTAQLDLRQAGTGAWFLQHRTYQTWRGGSKQTLFCPGIAGSGKSVIFATVVNDLQNQFEQDSDVVVPYFYCNYKRQDEQRLSRILSALVRQLFQEQSLVPQLVQDVYDKHVKRGSQPPVDELTSLVEDLCKSYSKVFILVDALDECTHDDFRTRDKLLSYLIHLRDQCDVNVNIMTTCRPGVVRHFDADPKIEIRAQPEDIARYLSANITSAIPCVVNHFTVQKKIIEGIADIVDGMFLLARLHLESMRDKTKIRAVLEALKTLPRGSESSALDAAYHEVLDRINHQLQGFKDLARKTLTWITHARTELSLEELREALAIEPGMTGIDPEIDLDDEQTILSVCAGLVIVDQESGVVRLAHYTTQVYLEHNQERWLSGGYEYVARSCIDYLSMQTFYANGMDWDLDLEKLVQKYKLLYYVGKNWGYHGRELEDARSYTESTLCKPDFLCFVSQLALGGYQPEYGYDKPGVRDVTPLHVCSYFDDSRAMEHCLDMGYDVNSADSSMQSALHVAVAMCGVRVIVQLLTRQDIDVNLQDQDGCTPLSWAAIRGHTEVVIQLLARQDIDVNLQDKDGETPLSWAASGGHTEVVAQLLARQDIDVNLQDKDGETPLSWAAIRGHTEVVIQLLARQDIDVNLQDKDGETPLYWAAWGGHTEVVAQLLARQDIKIDRENTDLVQELDNLIIDWRSLLVTPGSSQ